jgi:hypothetical protein
LVNKREHAGSGDCSPGDGAQSVDRPVTRKRVFLSDAMQVREIRLALEEADRGDFASDREVRRVLRKWIKS